MQMDKESFAVLKEYIADRRKDREAREKLLNDADIVFLCLPDAAARESVR